MKKYTFSQILSLLGMPVLTIVLGLILLFSPDTASALVGQILAWSAILAGIALGAGIFFGSPDQRNRRMVWTVICLSGGIWILNNPLTVARFLGRVLGITLMIRGSQSTLDNIRCRNQKLCVSRGLILGAVTLLIGIVLTVLPLATSRMFFNVIGIVLICLGTAEVIDRIRGRKQLEEGNDPNIIDVEKL